MPIALCHLRVFKETLRCIGPPKKNTTWLAVEVCSEIIFNLRWHFPLPRCKIKANLIRAQRDGKRTERPTNYVAFEGRVPLRRHTQSQRAAWVTLRFTAPQSQKVLSPPRGGETPNRSKDKQAAYRAGSCLSVARGSSSAQESYSQDRAEAARKSYSHDATCRVDA